MAKNDFSNDLKAKNKPKSVEYHYRKKGKNGRKKDIVTYSILPILVDKIERWAFHARKDKSEIVEAILQEALKNKDFDPIPEDRPIEL
ncbi:hypothetical protein ACFSKU_08995 [Pontibacter silvestris]|uniref:Ribbon-helix-helix protein CopG domain-containing protein n=1 Tax=Pontibacter silvestris TaxID=2305183 RepID=A0ABW4WX96_9BACT|nr:hypothetical protein [Pontibacter silvestris]MCC9138853.1 hypothetical protein [Pontibacter silvestris]